MHAAPEDALRRTLTSELPITSDLEVGVVGYSGRRLTLRAPLGVAISRSLVNTKGRPVSRPFVYPWFGSA